MEETINIRLTAIETRLAAIEGRLSAIEQSSTMTTKRRRKELTMEERQAIRDRLVAGKKAKREREIAEAATKAQPPEKTKAAKKEAKNGTSEKAD